MKLRTMILAIGFVLISIVGVSVVMAYDVIPYDSSIALSGTECCCTTGILIACVVSTVFLLYLKRKRER